MDISLSNSGTKVVILVIDVFASTKVKVIGHCVCNKSQSQEDKSQEVLRWAVLMVLIFISSSLRRI